MDISVTEFKQYCLEIIRRVERTGTPVAITRRGKVVAQLRRLPVSQSAAQKPWEQLRSMGDRLLAKTDESVVRGKDFERPRSAARKRLKALRGKGCITGDIMSPSGEAWDAERGRLVRPAHSGRPT